MDAEMSASLLQIVYGVGSVMLVVWLVIGLMMWEINRVNITKPLKLWVLCGVCGPVAWIIGAIEWFCAWLRR